MKTKLYDTDYYLWLEETAKLLREGKFRELDTQNLIEEIEEMGRSEKRSVESNLVVVLMHLLKHKYQPENRSNSWKYTIREHRRRLRNLLADSPSLKRYLQENFAKCYEDARKEAADETGLPLVTFPAESPFTTEQVLDSEYLPD